MFHQKAFFMLQFFPSLREGFFYTLLTFLCIMLGTLIPRKEVEVVETIRASIVQPSQALRLRARKETKVKNILIESINEGRTEGRK